MDTDLGMFLPGDNWGGQCRFLSLSSNSGGVEQVSRALFCLFLSGEFVRGLVLFLGYGGTELVRYPIERIVERDSERRGGSVNNLKVSIATNPRRGIHCT